MYDLSYVRKRKVKKIAALVSLFTAVGITSLVIVSFLGRTVGTFSVKLTNSDVKLSLSEKSSFKNATSYLHLESIPTLRETTYGNLMKLGSDFLDNEDTPVLNDNAIVRDEKGNLESIYFVKYTFFIRNVGNSIARYNLSINITDSQKSNDGTNRYVDDTLRIMVYENDANEAGAHDYRVFAKASDQYNYDKDGNRTMREFVATVPENHTESETYPLADSFISASVAAKYEVGNFAKNDVKRYTLVVWLEGEDPDTDNSDEPPEGATLKLGVDIAAYENA